MGRDSLTPTDKTILKQKLKSKLLKKNLLTTQLFNDFLTMCVWNM